MIAPLRFPDLRPARYTCSRCGAAVAAADREIRVMGRPACATYENPAGLACQIVTLSATEPLQEAPEGTTDHSWFEGYAWRPVACAGCGTFLGWRYDAVRADATPETFYGILVTALNRSPAPAPGDSPPESA